MLLAQISAKKLLLGCCAIGSFSSLCAMKEEVVPVAESIEIEFSDGLQTFADADAALIKKECATIADEIEDFEGLSRTVLLKCTAQDFKHLLSHLYYFLALEGLSDPASFIKSQGYFNAADLKDDAALIRVISVAEFCRVPIEKVPFRLIDKSSLNTLTLQDRQIYKSTLIRKLCAHFPLYKMPELYTEKFISFKHQIKLILQKWPDRCEYLDDQLAISPPPGSNKSRYHVRGAMAHFAGSFYAPVNDRLKKRGFLVVAAPLQSDHLAKISLNAEKAGCITTKYSGMALSESKRTFAYGESSFDSVTIHKEGSLSGLKIRIGAHGDVDNKKENRIDFDVDDHLYIARRRMRLAAIDVHKAVSVFLGFSCERLIDIVEVLQKSKQIEMGTFIETCCVQATEENKRSVHELFGVAQFNDLKKSYLSAQRSQSLWSALRGATVAGCSFLTGKMLSYSLPKLGSALKWGSRAIGGGWAAYKLWQAAKAQRSLGQLQGSLS